MTRFRPHKLLAVLTIATCCSLATTALVGVAGSGASASKAKSTIKIGFAVALTGTESPVMVPSAAAARAWQSMVNATGGIGGHPVKVIITDTAGSPAQMLSTVEHFVNVDHVAAVMTADDVAETAAQPFLTSHNIPVFGMGFTTTIWGVQPNYFPTFTMIPGTLEGQVLAAKKAGATAFGAVVCAEVAACLQAEGLFKPAAQSVGLQWTSIVSGAASDPNYNAQCLAMMQGGTNFISIALQGALVPKLVTDCNQQGYNGWYGSNANGFVQSLDSIGNAKFAGNAAGFPWWVNNKPVVQFRDAMKKYQPKTNYHNGETTVIWADLQLFRATMAPVKGAITPASVMKAYDHIKNQTLGGLMPQPITFTAGKGAPNITCQWLFTYHSGNANPVSTRFGAPGNGATGGLASSCPPANLLG